MDISTYFPVYDKLTPQQQTMLKDSATLRIVPAGQVVHNGSLDCTGFFLIRSGQLRSYSLSPEGREITLYRLLERDCCLFPASCMMRSLQYEITIETEKESEFWVIPPDVFRKLMDESIAVSNFANELMATRFSEVMWLVEQIMWKSFDKRLAGFLLEESALDGQTLLKITHEKIANHMGSAREVVTRMLRYFQDEGMVALNRGTIELTDIDALENLAE